MLIHNRCGWAGLTLGLVLGLVATGCGAKTEAPKTPEQPPNILFVSIDSLRADHLGCYGYEHETTPFLDSLALDGVRFENAVSTTSWTLPAHAAMFTGLLGPTHGLVDNGMSLSEDHVTMAELLKSLGYQTAGFFGGPYLHPTFGLAQGFEHYESCMTTTPDAVKGQALRASAMAPDAPSHADITGPRTRERVAAWADERALKNTEQPFFLFVHLWDVHYDYMAPKRFEDMFVDPNYDGAVDGHLMSNPAIRAGMSAKDLQHVLALYDAEIRFTDEVLRGMFDDLRGRGMLENTLVVITSDHGEEFFEHGMKGHNKTLFDEVLKVPLIVVWPGQIEGGRSVSDQVQIVDLLPTFASAARAPQRLPGQGRDLAPLLLGNPMDTRDALSGLFIDGQSQRALRNNKRKVVRPQDSGPALFFDLVQHPDEALSSMITPRSPIGQDRRRKGQAEIKAAVQKAEDLRRALGNRPPNQIELSPEMRSSLSSLGYMGSDD